MKTLWQSIAGAVGRSRDTGPVPASRADARPAPEPKPSKGLTANGKLSGHYVDMDKEAAPAEPVALVSPVVTAVQPPLEPPGDPVGVALAKANEARGSGRMAEARQILEGAAVHFPDVAQVADELARLAEQRRGWQEAERQWRRFVELSPDVWWGLRQVGHCLREQGRIPEAEALLALAQDRFPDEAGNFIEHARLAEVRADWLEADRRWAILIERFPTWPDGMAGKARVLHAQGKTAEARTTLLQAVETFPKSTGPLHELARLAQSVHDWPEAERCWRAFLSIDPNQWWAYAALANVLREQGRRAEAEAVLQSQLQTMSSEAALFIDYARLAERSLDWPEAEARWADVAARFPARWDGYAGRARIAQGQGDIARAVVILTEAQVLFPGQAPPLWELAKIHEAAKDWQAAESWWRAAIALEPAVWWAHTGLATSLREQRKAEEAEAVLAAQLDPLGHEPPVLIEYARTAERIGDWPEAAERWQRVIRRFPREWDGFGGYARAMREQGDIPTARKTLTEAADRFPTLVHPRADLARLEEAEKNWAAAEHHWRDALAVSPSNWGTYTGLANALRAQSLVSEAEKILTEAMGRFPNEPEPRLSFARLAEGTPSWSEAVGRWNDACERFPHEEKAVLGLAHSLREAGELEHASTVVSSGLIRFPRSAEMHERKARLLDAFGQKDQAIEHLLQAIALNPKHDVYYQYLSKLYADKSLLSDAEAILMQGLPAVRHPFQIRMALARLSERKGDVLEATRRFRECYEAFPQEGAAISALGTALASQGQYDEADSLLEDALEHLPGQLELEIAKVRLPRGGGVAQFPESLRRARVLSEKYPNNFEVSLQLVDALLVNHLESEAELILRACLDKFTDQKQIKHLMTLTLVRQGKTELALPIFDDLDTNYPPDKRVMQDYAAALIASKHLDEASTVVERAKRYFPADDSFSVSLLDILIAQNKLTEAVGLWRRLDQTISDDLRRELFARRGLLFDMGVDPASSDQPAPTIVTDMAEGDVDIKELVTKFESLGGTGQGCEFGLVQRFYGAEPLGLLRWTTMQPDQILEALETEFEGVGTPEQTILRAPEHGDHMEYGAEDRRFGMMMHTFVRADQVPHDKMFSQLCHRLTYLRTKLLEDLREGSKILVYKTQLGLSDSELGEIFNAVRRYGSSDLLYVRMEDEIRRFPLVVEPEPGLMIGYIDRLAIAPDGTESKYAPSSWVVILEKAYRLRSRRRRETCTDNAVFDRLEQLGVA